MVPYHTHPPAFSIAPHIQYTAAVGKHDSKMVTTPTAKVLTCRSYQQCHSTRRTCLIGAGILMVAAIDGRSCVGASVVEDCGMAAWRTAVAEAEVAVEVIVEEAAG